MYPLNMVMFDSYVKHQRNSEVSEHPTSFLGVDAFRLPTCLEGKDAFAQPPVNEGGWLMVGMDLP
jgi:hypothetical protein